MVGILVGWNQLVVTVYLRMREECAAALSLKGRISGFEVVPKIAAFFVVSSWNHQRRLPCFGPKETDREPA